MRITIFGATGLLGKALMREWRDDEVTGLGSADGDIRNAEQVLRLVQHSGPTGLSLQRPTRMSTAARSIVTSPSA